MKILALESSCDETAAAVISETNGTPIILSNIISSQIDLHRLYGGVVPEVAARAHIENVIPVIEEALKKARVDLDAIDYVAVTHGPGLIGSLVVGVETAKAISRAKKIPLIPINHLEGHIYASFGGDVSNTEPSFPILTLLVSGGNTLLILMKDHLKYEVVGQTIDDAAGEAFDKGAKLLELGYPGGPIISDRAARGDASRYHLPLIDLTQKPKRNRDGFLEYAEPAMDFSFSGLKTALLTTIKKSGSLTTDEKDDLCATYQGAIIDTLVQNSLRAVEKYKPQTFVLAGGVAANKLLREQLGLSLQKIAPKINYRVPDISLCGDNAAMIGIAAYYHLQDTRYKIQDTKGVTAIPNLKIA